MLPEDQEDVDQDALTEGQLSELFHHDPLDVSDSASADEPADGGGAAPPLDPAAPTVVAAVTPPGGKPVVPPAVDAGAPIVPPANGPSVTDIGNLPTQIAEAVRDAIKPPAKTADGADPVPGYMYEIPQQLQAALESENPAMRNKGYSLLIAGALRGAHVQIMGDVSKMLDKIRTELPQQVSQQQTERNRQTEVFNDFYDNHKDLRKPELHQFVHAQAMALARANPALIAEGWSPKFRDALAKHVRTILNWPEPKKPGQQKPPHLLNGGARPGADNLTGQAKFMADMFGSPK